MNFKIPYILALVVLLAACGGKREVLVGQLGNQESVSFQELYFKAQQAKLTGNHDKAFGFFQRAAEINPENDAIWYEMGRSQQALGSDLLALEYAQKATALDGNNEWYHSFEAELYGILGRDDAMEQSLLNVVELNPKRRETYQHLLEAQMRQGADKRALGTLDNLLGALGPHPDVYLNRYRIHSNALDTDAANSDVAELMEHFPANPHHQLMAMDHYLSTDQAEQAATLQNRLSEAGIAAPELQLLRSLSLMDEGKFEEALALQRPAFSSSEVSFEAKMDVAMRYFRKSATDPNQEDATAELVVLLIETHPSDARGHALAGDLYHLIGDRVAARNAYTTALDLDPSKDVIWQTVLSLDLDLKDTESLKDHSGSAMELFPFQPQYYLYNGMARLQLGDAPGAVSSLDAGRLLVLDDDALKAQFWAQLGDAHHEAGNHPKSDKAYQASLELEGDNVFVLNNYAYYLSLRGEDLARAESMSRKCNDLEPNQPSFMDTLGWIYFQEGKYDEAVSWLSKANDAVGAESGEILEHLGDAEFKRGNTEVAIKLWKAAATKSDASPDLQQKIDSGSIDE